MIASPTTATITETSPLPTNRSMRIALASKTVISAPMTILASVGVVGAAFTGVNVDCHLDAAGLVGPVLSRILVTACLAPVSDVGQGFTGVNVGCRLSTRVHAGAFMYRILATAGLTSASVG